MTLCSSSTPLPMHSKRTRGRRFCASRSRSPMLSASWRRLAFLPLLRANDRKGGGTIPSPAVTRRGTRLDYPAPQARCHPADAASHLTLNISALSCQTVPFCQPIISAQQKGIEGVSAAISEDLTARHQTKKAPQERKDDRTQSGIVRRQR